MAAKHYTFNELALGQQNRTQSKGEVWVASDGGHVVKYLLTIKGNADYFGTGLDGTQTWDYELTNVGEPVSIQLPRDCPGGKVDAPQLPGASNAVDTPGALTYDTSTSLADAAAFYQKQAPALGWKLQGQAQVTDTQAFMDFQRGGQDMIVVVSADVGVTTVDITLVRKQK